MEHPEILQETAYHEAGHAVAKFVPLRAFAETDLKRAEAMGLQVWERFFACQRRKLCEEMTRNLIKNNPYWKA